MIVLIGGLQETITIVIIYFPPKPTERVREMILAHESQLPFYTLFTPGLVPIHVGPLIRVSSSGELIPLGQPESEGALH